METENIVDPRCLNCFLKTYERLLDKFSIGLAERDDFLFSFHETLNRYATSPSPVIQHELMKKFMQITGVEDPFLEEKKQSNRIALELYDEWKGKVPVADNPSNFALRLALAGNIMDYGATDQFDISMTIKEVINADFAIDHSAPLQEMTKQAGSILYLGDNAGEIVFDRLFIETMGHPQVFYAVRGGPVLNDVTLQDASETGIGNVARILSNGYDAPSTVLSECSKEFLEIYEQADLIISKGQGNLEGLINKLDRRLFFLLMVKCDVIADLLNVYKNDIVVYNPLL